jgi:hypothetical protein
MRTRSLRAVVAVAAGALLAGCVQMPSSGPVTPVEAQASAGDVPGISFDPRPPQAGQTAPEIVAGFLEAMKATPISLTVARQFLSAEAAETWVPEQQIITYAELGTTSGQASVTIPLSDVNRYDERGAWQRTQARSDLDLGLVVEDGEWRIDELPDALIVPDSWFDDWYQRVSLYFFDPTSEVLVPEPVFAPRGEQFASSLVRGLLAGPGSEPDVARTYFPPDTRLGLAVPIESGIAQVALSGDPDLVDQDAAARMLAQLVWTLRQDDRIGAVQLSIGDRSFSAVPGGSTQDTLDVGSAYDPNGADASTELFALDRGRLVSGSIGAFRETVGPLGQDDFGVRSVAVNLPGSRVAAVSASGTDLLVAPTEAPAGELTRPVVGAVDLAAPHWDHSDRIWLLDRGAGRARVIVVTDGSATEVEVPRVSGRDVSRMLVSRDGSRLVAVVRGAKVDRVVSTRVRHDPGGAVVGFTPVVTLSLPAEDSPRIRDIGWHSPTTVAVLSDINEELSQVRTVPVDGAPENETGGTTRLRGPTRRLVSTPVDLLEVYALAGRTVTSLTRLGRSVPDLPPGITSLTYVG